MTKAEEAACEDAAPWPSAAKTNPPTKRGEMRALQQGFVGPSQAMVLL